MGSVGLAGCTSDSKDRDTDTENRNPEQGQRYSCYDEMIYRLNPIDIYEDVPVAIDGLYDWSPDKSIPPVPNLIRQLVNGETKTIEMSEIAPLEILPYFRDGEKVYKFKKILKNKERITAPSYTVQYTNTSAEDEYTYSFSDLPAHDQWRFYEEFVTVRNDCYAGYSDPEKRENSVMANSNQGLYIGFPYDMSLTKQESEIYYKLDLRGDSSQLTKEIQYSANIIAEDRGGFDTEFQDSYKYWTRLTDLDEDVRLLVEEAINGEFRECVTGTETEDIRTTVEKFEELIGVLKEEERRNSSRFRSTYPKYIQYNGNWYEFHRKRNPVQ
ncbi:hypothetical protein [Natrinema salaciae]|nr:hypothetical protein [Natrinema salaciae]